MTPLKVLLVGAGAVGQVYGVHLHQGGARVTFFVKARYRDELARDGMPLVALQQGKKRSEFRDFSLVSTPEEVAAQGPFDQVWLCMSSTALKGPWLEPLLAAIGDATVVALQPGLEDGDYLRARMPAERLVQGLIPMISYQCPLPGEALPPGVAWYRPPGKNPFSGAPGSPRAAAVVAALRAGGWPAKVVPDVAPVTALGSAMMVPAIAGLEVGGWKFKAFGRGEGVRLASAALRQTTQIARPGHRRLGMWLFSRPWNLRWVLFMGKRLLPLPLEVYLQYHFTKVGDQTRAQLAGFIARGRAQGHAVDAVEALLARLPPLD